MNNKSSSVSDKSLKEIAEAILANQGKPYNEWLREQHFQLLFENSSLVADVLKQTGGNR